MLEIFYVNTFKLIEFLGLFLIIWRLFPSALAVLHPLFESTIIGIFIDPLVLALSFRLSIFILSDIKITVGKEISSLSFSEALEPLALILVSFDPSVNTVSMCLIGLPFALIAIALDAFPKSVAFFLAAVKFPLVLLDYRPISSRLLLALMMLWITE